MSDPASIQQFDEDRAASYDDRIRQVTPGYDVLHEVLACTMDAALGPEAHILVVGGGTGTEIIAMGREQPGWRFTAVDPSEEMLEQCQGRLSNTILEDRVDYVPKCIEDVSSRRLFDGATSVFVSHFLHEEAAKHQYFASIARLLPPGAPFLLADLHAAESRDRHKRLWAAWRNWVTHTGGVENVEDTFSRIDEQISFRREEELAVLLKEVGFASLTLFYQSLLWGAWWTRRHKE